MESWLLLAATTILPGAAGFAVGRAIRRGDVIAGIVVAGVFVVAIAFEPLRRLADHPLEDDDLSGLGAPILLGWIFIWCSAGLVTGWIVATRARRRNA